MQPVNGTDERLDQVLAELIRIRKALETPAPPEDEVQLKEPKKKSKKKG